MFTLKGQVLGIDFLIIGIIYIICGCLAAISEVSIKIVRNYMLSNLKFSFSQRATKIAQSSSWSRHLFSKRPNPKEDCPNFFGFLRKAEL